MDTTLAELNQKIDALTNQVSYLSKQAQLAERQRQERSELIHDLMPIANDAFRLSVEQLEEIQEYVDLADLLRLVKRLARNGRNMEKMLDQFESMIDLVETVGPLADEAFCKAVTTLNELEQKGYFEFARDGLRMADNVVTAFDEDDINKLSDNIVLIINTVKNTTQLDTSLFSLIKQINDPAVRRGLALTLQVLHVVGRVEG